MPPGRMIIALMLLLSSMSPASAVTYEGLKHLCVDNRIVVKAYLLGVFETYDIFRQANQFKFPPGICIPDGTDVTDLICSLAPLDPRPDTQSALIFIFDNMKKRFPCPG
jgi:hypothetical protein